MIRDRKLKRPKIAIYDPSEHGGITQYTFGLAESLSNAGWNVTVITSQDYELADLPRSFKVWYLFKRSWVKQWMSRVTRSRQDDDTSGRVPSGTASSDRARSLRIFLILLRAALSLVVSGTRIVHFQWLMDRTADLYFMRVLRLFGIKVVYTVHDLLPHDEFTPENQAFYQKVYRYADRLIIHSESNRQELLELFTVDPARLCVIPVGCHTMLFDNFGTSSRTARQHLGIPDDVLVMLFFGQIKRYKGLEYLLKALESITARCNNVLLLIAGRISERDETVRRDFTDLLERYSNDPHVRIHNKYIPFDEVFSYFSAVDLVVLPYVKASQSAVLLMAYAAGKSVVATDTGGLGEVVENGRTGFIVPVKDPEALADASVAILQNSEVRTRFAQHARRLGETVYSWETVSAATGCLYQSLFS